jgi:lysophospholipid acyltransferase (LPLAT)-like uncharacterized protein
MKKKQKQRFLLYLATKLGWLILVLLGKTWRIKLVGRPAIDSLMRDRRSHLFALWHGRIVVPIYVHRGEGITAMVSLHTDGEMIARTLHRLGYRTVRGSSTRGGNQAFHDMLAVLKQGQVGAIIPDGPKGPRHHLKPGALYLAQQTGTYIIPVSFAASRKIEFPSWDRFVLPLPFSKNVMIYGTPRQVPTQLSPEEIEQWRLKLENEMNALVTQADDYFRK